MRAPTPESLAADVRTQIERARERRQAFLDLDPGSDPVQLLEAYDGIRAALDPVHGWVNLFTSVHPDEELRDAAEALEQELIALRTDLSLDRALYERLVALDGGALDDPLAARLLEHSLRDFRRSGVDRDEEVRERIRALREELVEVGQAFDRNIVQGGRTITVTDGHAGLAGLPQDYLDAHPEAADGSVAISTDPQDCLPFMRYAQRDDLRAELLGELHNRAWPENVELLERMLALRHELATLLGYPSWAEYVTEVMMATSASEARAFIERVIELASPKGAEEYVELMEERRKAEPEASELLDSERLYLIERVKESRFGFDSRSLRPYLAYDKVKRGLLSLSAELFGLEFRPASDAWNWHPDVESFDVFEGGRSVGRFHLDMFPRDGKYKHAAMFQIHAGGASGELPEAALVCNFPRPEGGDAGLMMHAQVTTFFHEFGHLLHGLLGGGQRLHHFSGIECERDFIEVPSQIYEEWAWDARVLGQFATHHQSGEPLPAELVRALRDAEEYGKALGVLRQMALARISLDFHDRDPAGLDTTAAVAEIQARVTPFRQLEDTHFQAGFGHLNGYSATYFTYMWSLVIAKDLFGAFAGDLLDGASARSFREQVLAPGGAQDAAEMVRDFIGRDYAFDAWEEWLAGS